MKERLIFIVVLLVTITLCIILLSMVLVVLYGLFDPSIDNKEVFKMIEPAFQTIVGGFIGLLAAAKLNKNESE